MVISRIKVAIFTTSRAEFGILYPLIKQMSVKGGIKPLLFVGGAHLVSECGKTINEIINCGIKRVVCEERYHRGKETEELFKQANVEFKILKDSVVKYSNQ